MTDTNERDTPISRVAFVVHDASMLLYEYNALATTIRKGGDQVRCFAPNISREDAAELDQQGIHCTQFSLTPEGYAVFARRRAIADFARLLDEWKPTHVIAIGGVELEHGVRAARKTGVSNVVAVLEAPLVLSPGVGAVGNGAFGSIVKVLKSVNQVVCLNAATGSAVGKLAVRDGGYDVCVTPRCGVDLDAFDETPLGLLEPGLVFHLSAPLDAGSGVLAFCEAAAIVKAETPEARFVLSGPPGQSESAISLEALEPFNKAVEYAGIRLAPKDDLVGCHIFVCLSRQEALPLVAMRALALGRPMIAANSGANRELVDERVNGCLVDPNNVSGIADALRSFVRRPELIAAMGRASRQKAVRRLDQRSAIATLLPLLGLAK